MNITPQPQSLPVATSVNVQTDALRRENNLREVIVKPEAATQSAAEKGVASERERAKAPGQSQESIDFEALRKQAEENDTTINGDANKEQQNPSSDKNNSENAQVANADVTAAEELELKELQTRDREVRAHELAHASVGGSYTGAPNYTFQLGPDGRQYAVGGEVSADLSPVTGDSAATIAKMEKVKAAALAPANPSSQDLRVAANATKLILQAQTKIGLELNQEDDKQAINQANQTQTNIKLNESSELDQEGVLAASDKNEQAFGKLKQAIDSVNVFSEKIDVDFGVLMERTLATQAQTTERPTEIDERASRIENFYQNITQAYDKAPSFQFSLAI